MKTILYIEDNFANQLLIQRLMEAYDYCLLLAETGKEGITKAKKHHIDLILLDLSLPDIDGQTVVKLLRQIPQVENTPIVAITAWPKQLAQKLAADIGCNACITKPINVSKFPAQIAEFLDN